MVLPAPRRLGNALGLTEVFGVGKDSLLRNNSSKQALCDLDKVTVGELSELNHVTPFLTTLLLQPTFSGPPIVLAPRSRHGRVNRIALFVLPDGGSGL